MRIREIQFNNNLQIETVFKSIFIELQLPLRGTVYEDVQTILPFEYIDISLGNTGHNSCDVRMLKLL
jgi:hypothetical protein